LFVEPVSQIVLVTPIWGGKEQENSKMILVILLGKRAQ
jgi:hypothetical protein